MTNISKQDFLNTFKYYSEETHQDLAIARLYSALPEELKSVDSEWIKTYRNVKEETVENTTGKVLDVKYFSQRDNYRDASRTCFSSSCAMLLEYLLPLAIEGDDDYIREVFKRGDSTESWVQLAALRHFGLHAEFVQNANNETLKRLIDADIPVPCGILHKGPESAPSGGGHWIVVVGYDDKGWIVNDPWGTLHHPSGTYVSTHGDLVHYSYELMDARWTVAGASDGWCIIAKEPKEELTTEELISKEDLAYIWNCQPALIKTSEIEEMNKCLRKYDITTPERIRHFLSQTAHESGGGRYRQEIASGWDYEYRSDLGNTQPGDGPKFKGAGYLQLTGRANYQALSDYLNDPRVMEGVEYVSNHLPFTSAGHWWMRNRMNDLIDGGASVEQVTRRVNGGYNGLEDRKYYYRRCQQVI